MNKTSVILRFIKRSIYSLSDKYSLLHTLYITAKTSTVYITVQLQLQDHRKDVPIMGSLGGSSSNAESYNLCDSMLHDIPVFPKRKEIAYSEKRPDSSFQTCGRLL